jgi:hypothetical protein
MAGIADYSTTPASNTTINSIGIQGTNSPANFDNAFRQLMADLATSRTDGALASMPYATKSAGYTLLTTDRGKLIDCTAALEIELLAAATAGAGFFFLVKANGGAVTLDPNGVEEINGSSTSATVANGSSAIVACNGTAWFTVSMLSSVGATLTTLEALTLGAGDMLYATAADTLTDLAIGTAGQFLVTNAGATAPEWASRPTLVSLEGLTLGAGDTLYATAADTLADLAIGTAGQVYRVNSGATAPEWGSSITLGTAVASTSGTSIDFTSIPSWAKRIDILFAGVSTNGTDEILVQIGDSGGIETAGYVSSASEAGGNDTSTAGFICSISQAAGSVVSGKVSISLLDAAAFTWVAAGSTGMAWGVVSGGHKSLSAALDRVRITTTGGTNTFDAGSINIQYE